jgi:hypothetical protein
MTAPRRRRNNAPVRPRRPATIVPDFMFAAGAAALTMAVVFFIASFVHEDLSNGDAGTQIARIFAATLMLSSIFLFLLGMLLLRADRNRVEHYIVPLGVGAVIGLLEAWMFLNPKSPVLLLLPLLLLVFVLRPVRRAVAGMFGMRDRR